MTVTVGAMSKSSSALPPPAVAKPVVERVAERFLDAVGREEDRQPAVGDLGRERTFFGPIAAR